MGACAPRQCFTRRSARARAAVGRVGRSELATRLDDDERTMMRDELVVHATDVSRTVSGRVIDAVFLDGHPVSRIVAFVEEHAVSRIVMSTRRRGGLTRLWLGSVSTSLLRSLTCPVLRVRAEVDAPVDPAKPLVRRLLVPLDDWEGSQAMLPHLLALADGLHADWHLFTTVGPGPYTSGGPVPGVGAPCDVIDVITVGATSAAAERLTRLAAELRSRFDSITTCVSTVAPPAAGILDHAEKPALGLIAISFHGRQKFGRVLFGGTTDKVVRGAQTPVLVHRPPYALTS